MIDTVVSKSAIDHFNRPIADLKGCLFNCKKVLQFLPVRAWTHC